MDIEESDLEELQSSLFTGVTVGVGSQVLIFRGGVTILIQCPFKCEGVDGVQWGHGEKVSDSLPLFQFLNHRVERVLLGADGVLALQFDVGRLTVIPEKNGLESYVFTSRLGICPVSVV
ncbi:hypothetical protein HX866_32800 [Pseudomonas gingeri]|nr:hypothetical protein [Pseudomonas gingeri]